MTKLADKPFALIGVNLNGYNAEKLKRATEKEQLNWRSFADLGDINAKWNALPQTFYVIDSQGVITQKWFGTPAPTTLEPALDKLIQAARDK